MITRGSVHVKQAHKTPQFWLLWCVLCLNVSAGIGVLGMKPLGSGAIVRGGAVSAIDCLHYALNLPTSVVITGMESTTRLDQALEAIRTFKPMSEAQLSALLAKTATLAAGMSSIF